MSIKVICQALIISILVISSLIKRLLPILALAAMPCSGCVTIRINETTACWPPPGPSSAPSGLQYWHFVLAAAVALALALIWGGLRARGIQPKARSPEMTREDLALLRTARDALVLLTRRQIARVFGGAQETWRREKERLP